jgi:hypothetical protein
MLCKTNKSLVAKKLHIYFNFISSQEIFIEHLLPDAMLGTECADSSRPNPMEGGALLRRDQSGVSVRSEALQVF